MLSLTGTVLAGLVIGSLPSVGLTFTSTTVNETVAVGTLTLLDETCQGLDLSAILSTSSRPVRFSTPTSIRQERCLGAVEWFRARLYPAGRADPVAVSAPCAP